MNAVKAAWPASDAYIDRLRAETQNDASLQAALNYTQSGWPKYKQDVILAARNFFAIRGELSTWNGILMKCNRLAIPQSTRKEVLGRIHEGHQGNTKCRARAQDSVWWPRISADIHERVSSCRECLERQPSQKKEPLLPSTPPERPFQSIGVDIWGQGRLLSREHRLLLTIHWYRPPAAADRPCCHQQNEKLFCSPWDSRDVRFGQRNTV